MEIGQLQIVDIDKEMQKSYLDYAMSVIVSRALPDARDGLKPVQRRILYAIYDMGLRPDSPYKKSARIVGEVLGKYHPHGDMAVYEAMARLAQDFSLRYPLIDGQGNFGSVDGDPPAAMRYTEARLSTIALELLAQIDRHTVDEIPNFDNSLHEPVVLPAAIPNLLVNGANGIAVGMATNIPPHNLGEVVDALVFMLQKWERLDDIAIPDLMRFIQGPDFPTGGIILQEAEQRNLATIYGDGRGRITVRGSYRIEALKGGRNSIIIHELPYLTNKTTLIERIAELVRHGDLEGISDLRDESDREGMRIVVELKQSADMENTLSVLYHRTPFQMTFGIALLALVNGEPRHLSLKQALRVYLDHRLQVVRRRSEFDLARAKARAHILEGLRVALKNLDEIISLIRSSSDVEKARSRIMKRYRLSENQAQAILDIPLKRLAALERKKIEDEYKQALATIKELEGLLHSAKKIRQVVEKELLEIKQKYSDRRRTQIILLKEGQTVSKVIAAKELIQAKAVWVGITRDAIAARTLKEDQPRISGIQSPKWLIKSNTHHTLYVVGVDGMAVAVAVDALPSADKFGEGTLLSKISDYHDTDSIAGIFSTPAVSEIGVDRFILTVTRSGMIKKSLISELPGPSAHKFLLVKVNPGDEVQSVLVTDGTTDVLLVTGKGMTIRFSESDVRSMGFVATGVNGIKLMQGDHVIGMEQLSTKTEVFLIADNGLAWRIVENDFPVQARYGQGTITCKMGKAAEIVGIMTGKRNQMGGVQMKKAAAQTVRIDAIAIGRRGSNGKTAVPVKQGDTVMGLTPALDFMDMWEVKRKTDTRKAGTKTPQTKTRGEKVKDVRSGNKPGVKKTSIQSKVSGKPEVKKTINKTRKKT